MIVINGTYEPERYVNSGSGNQETSISNEFIIKEKIGGEIIVAFLYDLCLEHQWNKKDSSSIYGGYIAGNPKLNTMTEFYTHQSWEIRNPVMPSGDIDTTSLDTVAKTSSFYFVINGNNLTSSYKKVHTIKYVDQRNVRTTYLNYYIKRDNNKIYLKEEFEFSIGKKNRSSVIIKRKYKYAIIGDPDAFIPTGGTELLKFHKGSITHSVLLTRQRVTKPSMIFKKGDDILYGALHKKKPPFDTFCVDGKYLVDPVGVQGVVLHFEMQMAEYRSHSGVGGYFRRIQVFNASGDDITNKCYFDAERFWYSVYDHKYHQHWPADDRNQAISQVRPGFDGKYDTMMTGVARSSKNHTANGWIKAFLVCPPDEYVERVVYQFGNWHRNVTYRLGYYDKNNKFKSLENFFVSWKAENFNKEYYLE